MLVKFKLRRGTQATWASQNPILASGEPGFETDTFRGKIGNGIAAWADLPYYLAEDDIAALIAAAISAAELEGVPGPPGDSAYEVAVDNGFVGNEAAWLASLQGVPGANGADGADGIDGADGTDGTDGTDGIDGSNGSDGDDGDPGPPGPAGYTYPTLAAGFVASTVDLGEAKTSSTSGPWVVRIWVPPDTAFSKVGVYITAAGIAGSVLNAFGLYDDSGNFVIQTPNNNSLWTVGGWRMQDFPSTVAAQGTGRFVRIAFAMNGSDPSMLYLQHESIAVLNGIASGHRRSWIGPSRNSGFPSTINVATEGTEFPYVPLVVLA